MGGGKVTGTWGSVDEIGGNEDESLEILSEKKVRKEKASKVGLE